MNIMNIMNTQDLFVVILAALVAANVVNALVVHPLINFLRNIIFGKSSAPYAIAKACSSHERKASSK